jgi:hypothetical protein
MDRNKSGTYRGMDDVSVSNRFQPGESGMKPRRDSIRAQLKWAMRLNPDDLPTVYFSVAQKLALRQIEAAIDHGDPVERSKMIDKLINQVDGRPTETKKVITDTYEDRLRRIRDKHKKTMSQDAGANAPPQEENDEF